jgi:hypothetical protein
MIQELPAIEPELKTEETLEEDLEQNLKGYKEQLHQLVKIVFFDKEAPFDATMEDLLGDVSKIAAKPQGEDGDMMNELMQMMGGMEGEGAADGPEME